MTRLTNIVRWLRSAYRSAQAEAEMGVETLQVVIWAVGGGTLALLVYAAVDSRVQDWIGRLGGI